MKSKYDEQSFMSSERNCFTNFSFLKKKIKKSMTPLVAVMLLLFMVTTANAQIIIESGEVKANFGIDADVQANGTWRIFDNNGDVITPAVVASDDWFENEPYQGVGGSGIGIIDVSSLPAGIFADGNNIAFTAGIVCTPTTCMYKKCQKLPPMHGRNQQEQGCTVYRATDE